MDVFWTILEELLTCLLAFLFLGQLRVTDDFLLCFDLTNTDFTLGQTLLMVGSVRHTDGQERPTTELK